MTIRSLPTPLEIDGDPEATEMIRVWLAHGALHVSLLLGMWQDADDCDIDEREAWGQLLADVARHVANGMAQSHGWQRDATLARIRRAFVENIGHHENTVSGGYVG
ncbi:MAG TPA: DUF5076 domain-containing protein [Lysobacter sp.]